MEAVAKPFPAAKRSQRQAWLPTAPGACVLCRRQVMPVCVQVRDGLQGWCRRCLARQRRRAGMAVRDLFL
jgi:hypothetical protein